jgi:hypothetical protein
MGKDLFRLMCGSALLCTVFLCFARIPTLLGKTLIYHAEPSPAWASPLLSYLLALQHCSIGNVVHGPTSSWGFGGDEAYRSVVTLAFLLFVPYMLQLSGLLARWIGLTGSCLLVGSAAMHTVSFWLWGGVVDWIRIDAGNSSAYMSPGDIGICFGLFLVSVALLSSIPEVIILDRLHRRSRPSLC